MRSGVSINLTLNEIHVYSCPRANETLRSLGALIHPFELLRQVDSQSRPISFIDRSKEKKEKEKRNRNEYK